MVNSIFKLIENTNKQVILKVDAGDTLSIARHPYVNINYDYITVTKGIDHTLTIIKKDGKTFSFSWGFTGYTLVSDNLHRLRREVCDYIERCGISLEN